MKLNKPDRKLKKEIKVEHALWVHGSIAEPEYPLLLDEHSRKGWGSTFRGREGTENWFHLPLSVPPARAAAPARLTQVFLFFHNTAHSPITALHVYDGPKRILALDDIALDGDHTRNFDGQNCWLVEPAAEIHFALSLSICVKFPLSGDPGAPRWILFTAAGADFDLKNP